MQYIIPYCNPKNYSFMLIKHKFVNQPLWQLYLVSMLM